MVTSVNVSPARFIYRAEHLPVYQNFFKAGDKFNIPTPNTQGIFLQIIV